MHKLILITPLLLILTSCKIVKGIRTAKKSNKTDVQTVMTEAHTLPFTLEGNKIIVKVKISQNGKEEMVTLMLDTGAPTLLSETFAKGHGLNLSNSKTSKISTPVAGDIEVTHYFAKDVIYTISGIRILKPNVRVMPISKDVTECGQIDGILGVDVLSQFNLAFDFKEKKITIYNKETLPGDIAAYNHVIGFNNFSFLQKTPQVTLKVNNTEDDFIWDTGFNGALYMRNPSKKSFDKWVKAHPESVRFESYGATADVNGRSTAKSTNYIFITDSIFYKKQLVSVHKQKGSNQLNKNMKLSRNNIGMGFMKNYNMLISWSNKKIYLQDVISADTKPSHMFVLVPGYEQATNSVIIRLLSENSKAYKDGIRTNDKLVSIGGKSVADITSNSDRCTIDETIVTLMLTAKDVEVLHDGKKQVVALY